MMVLIRLWAIGVALSVKVTSTVLADSASIRSTPVLAVASARLAPSLTPAPKVKLGLA